MEEYTNSPNRLITEKYIEQRKEEALKSLCEQPRREGSVGIIREAPFSTPQEIRVINNCPPVPSLSERIDRLSMELTYHRNNTASLRELVDILAQKLDELRKETCG